MYNLIMDMVNVFGYLLIPGFLALSIHFCRCFNPGGPERIIISRCRLSGGCSYSLTAITRQRVKY
jgi:hypothetical protein